MANSLNEAYVLGLWVDVERRAAHLERAMQTAQARAATVQVELGAALARHNAVQEQVRQNRHIAAQAAQIIADNNGKLTQTHQEVDALQRRSAELLDAMRNADDADVQRQVRRRRAALLVDIQDKQATLAGLSAKVDTARTTLSQAQQDGLDLGDHLRQAVLVLNALQAQLPAPQLFFDMFVIQASQAHCAFFVDGDAPAWAARLDAANAWVWQIHEALAAGRYRLDVHSDVQGGRLPPTADAMYAWVALGKPQRAAELFDVACPPSLFFHEIFHVFRCWCLGLFLTARFADLQALCTLHEYAEGVRGAYAQAFLALLNRDAWALGRALKALVHQEWMLAWRSEARALGVVNVNALALCRLAQGARLTTPTLGATVPAELQRLPIS